MRNTNFPCPGFDHAPAKPGTRTPGFDRAPAKPGTCTPGFDHAPAKPGTCRLVFAVALATPFLLASPADAEPEPFHAATPIVADPMLAPPPEAPRRMGSWDEAIGL